ncbi:MAG: DegV family protein [Ruminococcus flavefaciens]|nr:DegV family protein [Ruminococcus flavefaciens]MCM1229584.1 DegV family protein [Ruminococcus flavefaciens]
MSKTVILTDSGCDIPLELAEELGIVIMPFEISFSGQTFRELYDKSIQEFYEMMSKDDGIPKTFPLYTEDFTKMYQKLYNEGYTDIIAVLINSKGSETFGNAVKARDNFAQRYPKANVKINVVDSHGYGIAYGYAVVEAAKKLRDGAEAYEIIKYLNDWFAKCAIYIVPHTLKYARKSGRVSSAVALIGDILKIKPIIEFADYKSEMIEKIRGEKNIVGRLCDCVSSRMDSNSPYVIFHGQDFAFAREIEKELFKRTGREAEMYARAGCVVSANIGPEMVGVLIRRR